MTPESVQGRSFRTAAELLAYLRAHDVILEGAGEQLRYGAPPGVLTRDLLMQLIHNKHELLALLFADEPEVVWRVAAMRPQAKPQRALPVLTSRGDLPETPATCVSCGDEVSGERRYRCDPCRHAAWLTVQEIEGHEGDGRCVG